MDEPTVHICTDCKARAPATDTNYTLISSRYGWRLSRRMSPDGAFAVEWRCPRCWERFKKQRAGGSTPTEGVPVVRPDERAGKPSSSRPPRR